MKDAALTIFGFFLMLAFALLMIASIPYFIKLISWLAEKICWLPPDAGGCY